jgi:hypothetical protein
MGLVLAIAVIGSLVNSDFASLKTRRPLLYYVNFPKQYFQMDRGQDVLTESEGKETGNAIDRTRGRKGYHK